MEFRHDKLVNIIVRCGATYADLFVPPFEPWSASAAAGTRVSASGRLLLDDQGETTNQTLRSPGSGNADEPVGQEPKHRDFSEMFGEVWGGVPMYSSTAERRRCHLDLTQNGKIQGGARTSTFGWKVNRDTQYFGFDGATPPLTVVDACVGRIANASVVSSFYFVSNFLVSLGAYVRERLVAWSWYALEPRTL